MKRGRRRAAAAFAVALAVSAAAGCGGGSEVTGSTLRGVTVAYPDHLDPALSQTLEGVSAMWTTYLPLLTYAHADGRAGTRLIPGLARRLPRVTNAGRTYHLSLRPGLRYSDGTPVRASDFRHGIERALALNSPGSSFYTDIVGAAGFEKRKRGGIPGIRTDDRSGRITIRLRRPEGTFPYALALLYSVPVPPGTPREDLSANPLPATGPYEIVAAEPGRRWEYRRNPEWRRVNGPRMPQIPSGHFDSIEISVLTNPETEVNDVEKGTVDFMVNPPPPDRIAELQRRFRGSRLIVTPQIDVYYFWMNTRRAPFDDVRVRRAVNYAIDPRALRRIYGGQMRTLQQVLPQGMPGHRTIRPYPHDLAKARALIAAADPPHRQIKVWTDNYGPNLQAGEYYEQVLREIGFEPTLEVLPPQDYPTVVSSSSTHGLDTGWSNWYLDFPHPEDYFGSMLLGDDSSPTENLSRFDDPAVNRSIRRLARQPLGRRQELAYARLDRRVMRQAPWAPFGSLTLSTFVARGIDGRKVVVNPVFGQDLTSFAPAAR